MGAPTIYSTQIMKKDPPFEELARKAVSIIAVTAYASPSTIRELWDFAKKGTKIRSFAVYVDAGGSGVLGDTKILDKYRDINNDIRGRTKCGDSGIYLINRPNGIFHSKGYFFQFKTTCAALIGSYNLTKNAKENNEEILLRLDGREAREMYSWLDKEYLPKMRKDEVKLDEITTRKIKTFREFLLSGYLTNNSGRGKFWTASYGISERTKQIIDKANDPLSAYKGFVDTQFNIQDYLPDDLQLAKNRIINKANTKSIFSVATTMGKWIPKGLEEKFVESQKAAVKERKRILAETCRYLGTQNKRKEMENKFKTGLTKSEKALRKKGGSLDTSKAIQQFREALDRITQKLQDNEIRNRLERQCPLTPVPDVWFFDELGDDFEESFIESLNSRQDGSNIVVKKFRSTLNLYDSPVTRDRVEEALEIGIDPVDMFKNKTNEKKRKK